MDAQNITLSIPKDTFLKVKRLAAERQISVSELLSQTLEKMAQQEDEYEQARRRQLDRLEEGADLGTLGQAPASRDELHERPRPSLG